MIFDDILKSLSHRLEDQEGAVGLVDLDSRPFDQEPSKDSIIETHSLSRFKIADGLDELGRLDYIDDDEYRELTLHLFRDLPELGLNRR